MNKIYIKLTLLGLALLGTNMVKAENVADGDSLTVGFRQRVSSAVNTVASETVGSEVFLNSPEVDVVKALYGKVRGLQVNQGQGSSSFNYATLSLYGKTPLVLVDGFVRDISDLTSAEIESLTVLTDAASCALYGVRGGNGVVLVNTKQGTPGAFKVTADYTFGLNTQYRSPQFADSYLYATSINQALLNDGLAPRYNSRELDAFRTGIYPMEYPDVDWWNEVYRNPGNSHSLTMTFDGGGKNFRYYTVLDYWHDRAMLTSSVNDSRYISKTTDVRLNLRTNISVDLTRTTSMRFNIMAKLQENNTPNVSMPEFYSTLYRLPSAAFPVKFYDGTYGGSLTYTDKNPIAKLRDSGSNRDIYGKLFADLVLDQKLDIITEGLAASVGISFDNVGILYEKAVKTYAYSYHDASIDETTGFMSYMPGTWGTDAKVLSLNDQKFKGLYMETNFNAKITYDRLFGGRHKVGAAAIYDQYSYTANQRNSSMKRLSAILNAGYTYDDRYSVNVVTAWSGSAYLPDGDKMRFYPAVSAAWIISNEPFMRNASAVDVLRLHASHGLAGWDGNLTHELWRSSYVSSGSYFFTDSGSSGGLAESALPNLGLTVEKSQKTTLGLDLGLFSGKFRLSAEGFYERRSDILVAADNSLSGILGMAVGKVNEGVNNYKGLSAAIGWNDRIQDFTYGISGNVTFVTSEIVNDNQAYEQYEYLYHKGNRVNQRYGLEAIGFFSDEMDINNSPKQNFSAVRPGDVKYKDQNGDNVIDAKDVVKMYGSSVPEIWFGFSLNLGYRGFALSADFSGVAGVTANLLDSPLYKPLVDNGTISRTFLDRETPWTAADKAGATMPRLTTQANANNYQNSSLWYRDGSFLKLRNLTVAYTFPKKMIKFADMQIYVKGTNLFSFDNIGFADPEQLVATYPSIRSYWAGIRFNF